MAIPGDVGINRLITRPWPADETELVFYVSPTGDDNDDGLTPATAFLTLPRAMRELDLYSVNRTVVIELETGMTVTLAELFQSGGTQLGSINNGINLAATSPDNFFSKRNRSIRSPLEVVIAELDVTAQAFDLNTGLLTLTVNDALAPDQLTGRFAVGAVLGEYGVIASHTVGPGPNTIEVANQVGLTEPIGAYEPGATITTGDAGDSFEQCWNHNALCDWTFQGLSILHPDGKVSAITVWPHAPVSFTMCWLQGATIHAGAGVVTLDACYVVSFFVQDGATCSVTQSFFQGVDFLCHGSGASGLNEWVGTFFRACNAFGGGNLESRYSFFMTGCDVADSSSAGVEALFGTSRIQNTNINTCASNAVSVSGGTTLHVDNVQGDGNIGFGCQLTYGSTVLGSGPPTVTGGGGDVKVGDLTVVDWTDLPQTDLSQLCHARVLGT